MKKPAGLVQFYKQKTEKTKPNQNWKKPSQTGKTEPKPSQTGMNRFLSYKTEPKPVGLNRFRFGCFFLKNLFAYFFLIKTEPKMITPSSPYLYQYIYFSMNLFCWRSIVITSGSRNFLFLSLLYKHLIPPPLIFLRLNNT